MTPATAEQTAIDRANAAFWNELCGTLGWGTERSERPLPAPAPATRASTSRPDRWR